MYDYEEKIVSAALGIALVASIIFANIVASCV